MNDFSLTDNELEIMELMWTQERPLSRADIIELSPERSWKASSIHILLNKLISKGAIEVDGFVKTGKNYGRTYSPAITQNEYLVNQFKMSSKNTKLKSSTIIDVVLTLLKDDEIDDSVINELENIIKERKGK